MQETNKTKISTKKMVTIAMLVALSYTLAVTIRFPLLPQVGFIEYSPSDIPIIIGGMIFGPIWAFIMSLAVSFLEGITIGHTGLIGVLMNICSTSAFAVTLAIIYKKSKTTKGAIIGFVVGSISLVIVMIILNILLTPIYTGVPREKVIGMLLPAIIPVNSIKAVINSVVSFAVFQGIFKYIKAKKYDQE